jgi:PEP-CTERM motif
MKSVLTVVAVLTAILVSSTVYGGVYAQPWLPNWSSDSGYTSQFWDFHWTGNVDSSGNHIEPTQPLAADNYSINPYGTATATWLDNTAGTVGWTDVVPGSQPSWTSGGAYGGNVGSTPAPLTLTVPTGSDVGSLLVYVQYDWYHYQSAYYGDSAVTVSIAGATDVTSSYGYTDVQIGVSGSGKPWERSTKVFEFTGNPGDLTAVLDLTGFAPIVDSVSVTTAVVPEPTTIAIMSLGALLTLRKRRV